MKGRLTLQQRLVLPVLLLGLIMLLSNILAVFSIHNVNAMQALLSISTWSVKQSWKVSVIQ